MVNLNVPLFSKVKVTTAKDNYEGLFMPKEGDTIVIKLDSGYNVGVLPEHITNIDIIAAAQDKAEPTDTGMQTNDALPTISILHTGGTIASRVDYKTGGVDTHFRVSDLVALMPEIKTIANISGTQVGSMWSEDLRFGHLNNLAKTIRDQFLEHKTTKFIVTSGTDFLHYVSTGLAFILKDMPVSVVCIAAQRSSDRGSSDAPMNFLCAAQLLAQKEFQGVVVCMHDSISDTACSILPAVNIKKMHSTRRDTFKAINLAPLGTVTYPEGKVDVINLPTHNSTNQKLWLFKESIKVGLVYSHPQFYPEELKVYEKFDGLVMVGSGLGLLPINQTDELTAIHEETFAQLQSLANKIPVAMATQTVHGRINMNVYAPGRRLNDIGILGSQSAMIAETSFIKLAWLLSNFDKKEIPTLFMQDIVGEQPSTISDNMFP